MHEFSDEFGDGGHLRWFQAFVGSTACQVNLSHFLPDDEDGGRDSKRLNDSEMDSKQDSARMHTDSLQFDEEGIEEFLDRNALNTLARVNERMKPHRWTQCNIIKTRRSEEGSSENDRDPATRSAAPDGDSHDAGALVFPREVLEDIYRSVHCSAITSSQNRTSLLLVLSPSDFADSLSTVTSLSPAQFRDMFVFELSLWNRHKVDMS